MKIFVEYEDIEEKKSHHFFEIYRIFEEYKDFPRSTAALFTLTQQKRKNVPQKST
jgi:hypothetical protein